MKFSLNLDYEIPEGDLAPYFEGLRQGQAMASGCAKCGRVFFPARTCCFECGISCDNWKRLSGRAKVLHRAGGFEGRFALVQFEGATTLATVAIVNVQCDGETGLLVEGNESRLGPLLRITPARV